MTIDYNAMGVPRWMRVNYALNSTACRGGLSRGLGSARIRGLGKGRRVDGCGELMPAIEECRTEGGVQLIEVPIDYSEDERLLHQDVPAPSQALTLEGV